MIISSKQARAYWGSEEMSQHPVVLAQFGVAWRLGVQTDVMVGGLAAVFVPNSPNTFSGSVFFLASEKIRPLNVSLAGALGCLERCGVGGGSLLSKFSIAVPEAQYA